MPAGEGPSTTSQADSPERGRAPSRRGLDAAAGNDPATLHTALAASRRLLRARTEDEAVAVVVDTVERLGGTLEVPDARAERQLPIDVTFGLGDPLVPAADGPALAVLRNVLPAVVEDAHVALGRLRREGHLTSSASTDILTGLANRRVAMRVLSRLEPGDVVAIVDLDHFKAVNDDHGHDAGDEVLRSFSRALRRVVRTSDTVGRLGGEEFLLLLPHTDVAAARGVLGRLEEAWLAIRPRPVTFSAGVAAVEEGGGRDALSRADRALYVAKRAGRDRVEVAP